MVAVKVIKEALESMKEGEYTFKEYDRFNKYAFMRVGSSLMDVYFDGYKGRRAGVYTQEGKNLNSPELLKTIKAAMKKEIEETDNEMLSAIDEGTVDFVDEGTGYIGFRFIAFGFNAKLKIMEDDYPNDFSFEYSRDDIGDYWEYQSERIICGRKSPAMQRAIKAIKDADKVYKFDIYKKLSDQGVDVVKLFGTK